eukprot:GHVL01018779.1.p1 GENE.GHVL01018779.1~~GHVL01018779.1.p1  ORF type:complete len:135 (+),score=10.03 GHVL01018779.1:370-774(+)
MLIIEVMSSITLMILLFKETFQNEKISVKRRRRGLGNVDLNEYFHEWVATVFIIWKSGTPQLPTPQMSFGICFYEGCEMNFHGPSLELEKKHVNSNIGVSYLLLRTLALAITVAINRLVGHRIKVKFGDILIDL